MRGTLSWHSVFAGAVKLTLRANPDLLGQPLQLFTQRSARYFDIESGGAQLLALHILLGFRFLEGLLGHQPFGGRKCFHALVRAL